jgi:hypothetical protein
VAEGFLSSQGAGRRNWAKLPALRGVIQSLSVSGHRSLVMLTREERRKPNPGMIEQIFLDELENRGIPTGPRSPMAFK